jgi:hypothetical protein
MMPSSVLHKNNDARRLKRDQSQSLVLLPIYLDAFTPIFTLLETNSSARQRQVLAHARAGVPASTPVLMSFRGERRKLDAR